MTRMSLHVSKCSVGLCVCVYNDYICLQKCIEATNLRSIKPRDSSHEPMYHTRGPATHVVTMFKYSPMCKKNMYLHVHMLIS